MSKLLEKYEAESIIDLFKSIVVSVMVGTPIGYEIYQDLVTNNLTNKFAAWYNVNHTDYLSINELLEAINQLNPNDNL